MLIEHFSNIWVPRILQQIQLVYADLYLGLLDVGSKYFSVVIDKALAWDRAQLLSCQFDFGPFRLNVPHKLPVQRHLLLSDVLCTFLNL